MGLYKSNKSVKSKKDLVIIIKYLKKHTIKVVGEVLLFGLQKPHYQDLVLLQSS